MADFKVGTRHYDLNASEEKKNGLIEKQKGTTTESLGVRLIDAKIRKGGEVTKAWDRKQGLKFSFEELQDVWNEFVPSCLRSDLSKRLDEIYGAFEKTVEENPGFRMYASSLLIAYDGDKPTEIRAILIDFAHTHISIDAEGADSTDPSFDDGVIQGLTSLMNFESGADDGKARAATNAKLDITLVKGPEGGSHKRIKKCIVNPGNHKCYIRPDNPHENEAYTTLTNTALVDFIPKFYGVENKAAVVEDVAADFKSPCIADFKIGAHSFDIDESADKKGNLKVKDEKTTTHDLSIRLIIAALVKDGKVTKEWKRKENASLTEAKLKEMVVEFIGTEAKANILKELKSLRKAFISTQKSNKNFRLYNASLLIIYDGDEPTKQPRCVLTKLSGTHIDIQKENYNPKDPEFDDGVVDGLDNLIDMASPSSKCCLLI
ncbi:hypothetical protein TRFO_27909 [Tritrichomonas foetus]|uniref:Kinase n=1 Tax=Tritrichomonas foetus TaxID=1144522 RepID=A0A1J4JZI4_9EUKA|nr:hypothetical protein TRFO_27909 [Tritrichomonas foetus]|eukprot:OHT04583.1 hypothetical protein TRFO_27909 [Tritrichomonas foetus]